MKLRDHLIAKSDQFFNNPIILSILIIVVKSFVVFNKVWKLSSEFNETLGSANSMNSRELVNQITSLF